MAPITTPETRINSNLPVYTPPILPTEDLELGITVPPPSLQPPSYSELPPRYVLVDPALVLATRATQPVKTETVVDSRRAFCLAVSLTCCIMLILGLIIIFTSSAIISSKYPSPSKTH